MKYIILMGGPAGEHEVSIETGKNFSREINKYGEIYHGLLSKEGKFLITNSDGIILLNTDNINIFTKYLKINNLLVINALHGKFGEDGRLQKILESSCIPFTGPSHKAAKLTFNKYLTQQAVKDFVNFPKTLKIAINSKINIQKIFKKLGEYPIIAKPNKGGSSVGIHIINNEVELRKFISSNTETYLLQNFIKGKELSIGVVSYQNQFWNLPITQIIPNGDYFDYENKYSAGVAREITPAQVTTEIAHKVKKIAQNIHKQLGLGLYSRCDFIVKDKKLYFLEVNSLPGFTANSLVPQQLKKIGKYELFFKTMIQKLNSSLNLEQ